MRIIFIATFLFFGSLLFGQNNLCSGALLFCPNPTVTYPAGVNTGSGESGPNYGCLGSQPNPAWYYLNVASGGSLQITFSAIQDIDFICYGPFNSLTGACGTLSSATNIAGCSYSASNTETLTINSCNANEFYLVMITNFSNIVQNISLTQTGGDAVLNCVEFWASGDQICAGSNAIVSGTVGGLSSPNFSIMPGGQTQSQPVFTVSPAVSTNYTLYATGITSQSVTQTYTAQTSVLVNPSPTVVAYVASDTLCAGNTASVYLSGALSYTLVNSGATLNTTFQVYPSQTTSYSISGTSGFGCVDTTVLNIIVIPCTGIAEINFNNDGSEILVFPNPAKDVVHINVAGKTVDNVRLMDMRGIYVKVPVKYTEDGDLEINLAGFNEGVYFFKLVGQNFITYKRLLIVNDK